MGITHQFVSAVSDGSDPTQVQPSNWNATHVINIFVDDEVPAVVDSSTLTLVSTPSPATSLMLFKNGQLLYDQIGFTLNGLTVTLLPGYEDNSDSWRAWYRKA